MCNLDRNLIFSNFQKCVTWRDKYFYIVDLGSLLILPINMYRKENIITGCQSKVWIVISYDINKKFFFYGYSDSYVIKGLIFIIFIFYKNLSKDKILNEDIYKYLNSLSIASYLTSSRSRGIESIIKAIYDKINFI